MVVFITHGLFFLLLVLYICIHRRLLPKFTRILSNNFALTVPNTNSGARNFLFRIPKFLNLYSHDDVQENREKLGIGLIKRYEHKHGCEKEMANNECAICLGEIEEGDEIRELRCDHVFHMVCLDRWVVGYRHETCPMCRGRLAPPRKWATGLIGEEEVLVFNLFPCRTNRRRSTRWLID
ncbi:hypothetical protein RHSIM_Rhsim09G0115700 [Rhododendron simsii]|uniref:RING-type domain-containing protein n=1 Tax=Rhododendron simsii TaxID=118357 RepID=A0A834GGT3_RHOSS|nr:hypothetical protein RHSIM_Rhsim09G0115700 [Rhododendron simsii]